MLKGLNRKLTSLIIALWSTWVLKPILMEFRKAMDEQIREQEVNEVIKEALKGPDEKFSYDSGGLVFKYIIFKRDGTPVDPEAQYFVGRIDTDPYARFAVRHYAQRLIADDVNREFGEGLLQWLEQTANTPGGIKQKEISDRIERRYTKFLHREGSY